MSTVLTAALMYGLVLVLLRVTTRRIMRSATPLDMAVVFLFGGLAVQPILGQDRSVTGALLAICTVAGMHLAVSRLKLWWPAVGMVAEGTPVVIYANGIWDRKQMRRLRVDERDVVAEMRQNGIRHLSEVQSAIIEHTGGITIVRKEP
ncbi:DUF421 domain-containing protein [Methylobacterium sp. ID0610]|uniref:DUF421 domain-containing protein n=1 Tax=Methylobacterium carpenticola TaxID=3344827 RepID=UPI003684AD1F